MKCLDVSPLVPSPLTPSPSSLSSLPRGAAPGPPAVAPSHRLPVALLVVLALLFLGAGPGAGGAAAQEGLPADALEGSTGALEAELGRNEVRVQSAAVPLAPGRSVWDLALSERLERRGYRRVSRRPERPGEYFWGNEVFWIYRRAHRLQGRSVEAERFGLVLDPEGSGLLDSGRGTGRGGRIVGFLDASGEPWEEGKAVPWLEPVTLAEALEPGRAPRTFVPLTELPEHTWQALLAAEDHRFFDHGGVDARAVARALLANARAGGVVQGGSTITQQLVKLRELSPERTLGRKVSEAFLSLSLEAQYTKAEILEGYLNHVYYGHVEGSAVYGVGAAARAYFSKDARELTLAESALLAALVQGPNRLSPVRHPDRARSRQAWILDRLEELEWASDRELRQARAQGLPRLRLQALGGSPAPRFLGWIRQEVEGVAEKRLERGRGVEVDTTLDPQLQAWAREAVRDGLAALERQRPALARQPLSAALVALDAETGAVLAHVGGDPRDSDDTFDRGQRARRQPGSAVKPLVLLEAFDDCGDREPLFPAQRVLDEPLTLELPSGPWRPVNPDGRFRGVVDARTALVRSLNVPLVRMARWCGFGDTAGTFRRAGLELPDEPTPAFVLGAVETSPAALAGAYTAFAGLGTAARPLPLRRVARPGGTRLAAFDPERRAVADPAAAFLVRDLLRDAVLTGTARGAAVDGLPLWGKTGTSSDERDAWFVGGGGSVVTAVWVGLDDNRPLGLAGSQAAAPIWKSFMAHAVAARPPLDQETPSEIVLRWVEDDTGRLLDRRRSGAHADLFDRRYLPPGRRWLLPDPPLPPVE